jgi:truncated hemoglobin YjbI
VLAREGSYDVTTADLKAAETPNPHFARIGGESEVRKLVDAFYRRMDTLPEAVGIRAMHGATRSRRRCASFSSNGWAVRRSTQLSAGHRDFEPGICRFQ